MALAGVYYGDRPSSIVYEAEPMPTAQGELRRYRQRGRTVILGKTFCLSAEVAAIAGPLAERLAVPGVAAKRPVAAVEAVQAFLDAVHDGLAEAAARWAAEPDARRRTAHLTNAADRARSVKHLLDLAPRPVLPEVKRRDVAAGLWASALADGFKPFDKALALRLRDAPRPDDPDMAGRQTLSDHVVLALRQHLDRPARALEHEVGLIERITPPPPGLTVVSGLGGTDGDDSAAGGRNGRRADREAVARAELERLGVEVPS